VFRIYGFTGSRWYDSSSELKVCAASVCVRSLRWSDGGAAVRALSAQQVCPVLSHSSGLMHDSYGWCACSVCLCSLTLSLVWMAAGERASELSGVQSASNLCERRKQLYEIVVLAWRVHGVRMATQGKCAASVFASTRRVRWRPPVSAECAQRLSRLASPLSRV
jgi:hypothetical protein